MTATRRKFGSLLAAAAAVGYLVYISGKTPRDQALRFVLGDAASRVVEVRVRYLNGASAQPSNEEIAREASFRFPGGTAPRIVSHDPRLADGEYVVEFDLITAAASATLSRRVSLVGSTVSIDLSESVPK